MKSNNYDDLDLLVNIADKMHQEDVRNKANTITPMQKSHTQTHQSQKRKKFYRYKPTAFVIASVITISSVAATIGIDKVSDKINDNHIDSELKNYVEQIYNANDIGPDDKIETRNALQKSKYHTGGFDKDDYPLWAVDYDRLIEDYLELPDETVNSNIYTFYLYFSHDYASFNDFIFNLAFKIEKVKENYPYTYELIHGCKKFDDFLEKNYKKYQLNNEDLTHTFIRMNQDHFSIIDLPELEEEARSSR